MDHNSTHHRHTSKILRKSISGGQTLNVHIGMWGMSHNMKKSDIKIDSNLPETIKLGRKMLVKSAVYNKFKSMENKIRTCLYNNSFEFPLVAQAHFVPKAKFIEVYRKLDELRTDYLKMVDEFIQKYEDYKIETIAYYKEHEDAVDITDLEKSYPSIEKVKDKFYMDIVSFEVQLPAEFGAIDLQTAIDRELSDKEAKQKALKEYQTQYQSQLETHMHKFTSFVDEATATLRSKVAEYCTVALEKIENKEVVAKTTIKSLLRNIEEFRQMNFTDDQEVAAKLNDLEKLLVSGQDFSSENALGLLQQRLSAVVTEASKVSDTANVSGEYFRKLSV